MKSRANLLYPITTTGRVSRTDQRKRRLMLFLKRPIRELFPHLYNKEAVDWYRLEFYPVAQEGLQRVRKLCREKTPYFILTFHDDQEKTQTGSDTYEGNHAL